MKNLAVSLLRRLQTFPALHAVALRTFQRVRPPWFRTANAEILYTHWTMISAACSADGRQLGEGNTVPIADRRPFPIDYRVGKLDGSRLGLPVNQIALQTVMRTWDSAISIIEDLRNTYIASRKLEDRSLNYIELLALAKICTSLSAYLLRRKHNPIADGAIPVPVATIYKLVMGVHATVDAMINNGESWFDPDEVPTAEFVYEYADAHNLFLSRSKVACGGPKKKIHELLEVLINGTSNSAKRKGYSQQDILTATELQEATDYGMSVLHLEIAIRMYQSEIGALFANRSMKSMHHSDDDKQILERLGQALDAGIDSVELPEHYWEAKSATLRKILVRLGGDSVESCPVEIPEKICGQAMDNATGPSLPQDLNVAICDYEAIIQAAYRYCCGKQKEVCLRLGVSGPVKLTERQVAKRLNKKVFLILTEQKRLNWKSHRYVR